MVKKIIPLTLIVISVCLIFTGCKSYPVLKGDYFSDDYRNFLKSIASELPESVQYEVYTKKEGFSKEKLVTDSNSERLRQLCDALLQITIVGEVKTATNYNVKHYSFTDKDGNKFTFDFYGKFLKVENKFYETDNYTAFINVPLQEQKNGEMYLTLEAMYYGSDDEKNVIYAGTREVVLNGKAASFGQFNDYRVAEDAHIIAPVSGDNYGNTKEWTLREFFENFKSLKGESNNAFIFKATVKETAITYLAFDYELYKANFRTETKPDALPENVTEP